MTKEEKREQAAEQLEKMLLETRESLFKKLDKALSSGALPDKFLHDNALLAKCVFDSECRDRKYSPPTHDKRMLKEFNNVHIQI